MSQAANRVMDRIGFIGLGIMGYPMASNLIQKLPATAGIWIFDVSKEILEKFANEHDKAVHICSSSKEVAESTVSLYIPFENPA